MCVGWWVVKSHFYGKPNYWVELWLSWGCDNGDYDINSNERLWVIDLHLYLKHSLNFFGSFLRQMYVVKQFLLKRQSCLIRFFSKSFSSIFIKETLDMKKFWKKYIISHTMLFLDDQGRATGWWITRGTQCDRRNTSPLLPANTIELPRSAILATFQSS